MYYKPFQLHALDALSSEKLSMGQMAKILAFYREDTFVLPKDSVADFKSKIPDVEERREDDLYYLKVNDWPYHKNMCLHFAPSQPCEFMYIDDEMGRPVFYYNVDTYAFRLASTLSRSPASQSPPPSAGASTP